VDLNKFLSILGKKFVGDDYFIITHRRTNGSTETIHCSLYEGDELNPI
jgi:hypothetical protein